MSRGRNPPLIPAVCLYRKSDDDKGASVEQQRREVHELAEREGYEILRDSAGREREYTEYARSGSREWYKRVEFHQLLADSERRDFQAILCWDTSRFARLDSIDGAEAKKTLRRNGVHLATVYEGKIDWNEVGDRWKDMALSECNKDFSLKVSRGMLRGLRAAIEAGGWPSGSIPYGYDRQYVSPDGKTLFHRRNERGRKPKFWEIELVLNEAEAAVVRRIFADFVERDQSRRAIARQLNGDCISSPNGRKWSSVTVTGILHNKAYIGYGRLGQGQRHAQRAEKRIKAGDQFNQAVPAEKPNCCPVIIDDEQTWYAAQRKLDSTKRTGAKPQSSRASVLSSLLTCGHCGQALVKKVQRTRSGTMHVYYRCKGHQNGGGCDRQHQAREDVLLPAILRKVIEAVDAELLVGLKDASKDDIAPKTALLEKHTEVLRERRKKAMKRYMTLPDNLQDEDALELVKEIDRELREAEEKARAARKSDNEKAVRSFHRWWDKAKLVIVPVLSRPAFSGGRGEPKPSEILFSRASARGPLVMIDRRCQEPVRIDTDVLRGFLRKLGVKATCYWTVNPKRKINFLLDRARLRIDVEWFGNEEQACEPQDTPRRRQSGPNGRSNGKSLVQSRTCSAWRAWSGPHVMLAELYDRQRGIASKELDGGSDQSVSLP